jgi:hypothetical protein
MNLERLNTNAGQVSLILPNKFIGNMAHSACFLNIL